MLYLYYCVLSAGRTKCTKCIYGGPTLYILRA